MKRKVRLPLHGFFLRGDAKGNMFDFFSGDCINRVAFSKGCGTVASVPKVVEGGKRVIINGSRGNRFHTDALLFFLDPRDR